MRPDFLQASHASGELSLTRDRTTSSCESGFMLMPRRGQATGQRWAGKCGTLDATFLSEALAT